MSTRTRAADDFERIRERIREIRQEEGRLPPAQEKAERATQDAYGIMGT